MENSLSLILPAVIPRAPARPAALQTWIAAPQSDGADTLLAAVCAHRARVRKLKTF